MSAFNSTIIRKYNMIVSLLLSFVLIQQGSYRLLVSKGLIFLLHLILTFPLPQVVLEFHQVIMSPYRSIKFNRKILFSSNIYIRFKIIDMNVLYVTAFVSIWIRIEFILCLSPALAGSRGS